jgi:glutathione peroxidase-family protein
MAKKKKNNDDMSDMHQAGVELAMMVMTLIECGVTPKQYESMYNLYGNLNTGNKSILGDLVAEYEDEVKQKSKTKSKSESKFKPTLIKSTDNKTIKLKVQLRGVSKPPVWRELLVPSYFTFLDLHEAIQYIFGFYFSHLWTFGHAPYDQGLCITLDDSGQDFTHDASTTDVIDFLGSKGNKLVYLYDFGDDWTFDITVLDVLDESIDCAQLGKWKGNLQPLEDTGGMYSYIGMRAFYEDYDFMSDKERAGMAEEFGFDDHVYLKEILEDAIVDPEFIQQQLSEIKPMKSL